LINHDEQQAVLQIKQLRPHVLFTVERDWIRVVPQTSDFEKRKDVVVVGGA